MGRKAARKHAFIIVYQSKFHKEFDCEAAAELYLPEIPQLNEADKEFVLGTVRGTFEHLQTIDKLITDNVKGWDFQRINTVDLAIMRLAIFEMKYLDDIPTSVSINEALELAKIYGCDNSAGFVNGLLGKVAAILGV